MNKVLVTKSICVDTGLNLAAAKAHTDSVLERKIATLDVPDAASALLLVEELIAAGIDADVED